MYRVLPIVVTLVLILLAASQGGLASATPSAGPAAPLAGAPLVVSYQGQLNVAGVPYTGQGYFKFAITDGSLGGLTFWSNDGTSVDGSEPTDAVELAVANGLFDVLLGDTLLAHMTPLPPAVFEEMSRYLQVWFASDPADAFVQLSPGRRIASVPYALQAADAANADALDGEHVWEISDPLHRGRPPQAHTTVIADTGGDADSAGMYSSATIGADGLPVISYFDDGHDTLRVLHCGNPACTAGNTIAQPDSAGNVGMGTSITIGPDGLPLIAYHDQANFDLKVLHCGNVSCTAGNTITTAESLGDLGLYASVAIGIDGLPVISHYDSYYHGLIVTHCADAFCTTVDSSIAVDSGNDVGMYTSLAIGADGMPVISYYDATNGDLKVAYCWDPRCTFANNTITTVDSSGNIGLYTSIAIGADSLPVIAYGDITGHLKVLHCSYFTCSQAGNAIMSLAPGGVGPAITIGADGLPVITHVDSNTDYLSVVHCGNATCGYVTMEVLDGGGTVGGHTALTIGADGLPLISYWGFADAGDLKVAHCANTFCTPYFRRR